MFVMHGIVYIRSTLQTPCGWHYSEKTHKIISFVFDTCEGTLTVLLLWLQTRYCIVTMITDTLLYVGAGAGGFIVLVIVIAALIIVILCRRWVFVLNVIKQQLLSSKCDRVVFILRKSKLKSENESESDLDFKIFLLLSISSFKSFFRFFRTVSDTIISCKVHLHWTKANAKANFFFDLCGCSMWTLNWVVYEPIWKRCRFSFHHSVNEPLSMNTLFPSIDLAS